MKPKRKYPDALTSPLSVMPPLPLYPDRSKPFDPADSPVLRWIGHMTESNADLAKRILDAARCRKLVTFDQVTGLWTGVAWQRHVSAPETPVDVKNLLAGLSRANGSQS
jgi:hypothetical protein